MKAQFLARIATFAGLLCCCGSTLQVPAAGQDDEKPKKAEKNDSADPKARLRHRMVERDLAERGITNKRVLDAFRTVPRHEFLPPAPSARPTMTNRFPSAKARPSPLPTTSHS